MIFVGIILLGFISWNRLPQELYPSITYPQITIVTSYENAAPEEIESLITKIIEEAVGTVNNVKRVSSISKEGLSLVMVEFAWGANMDFAALNVREKIDLIKERLPRECREPIVMKYNPFDLPILNIAVTGDMPPLELRRTCKKYIKDAIEKVEGVASAIISGGDEREILVEIDQPRLRASGISIVSVVDSLKTANINYPAGTIKESFYEYLIRTMGEYQTVEEIQETPTALELPEEEAETLKEKEEKEKQGRRLVYLKDISRVKDTVKEKSSISRYNAKDSVSLVVRKQSGTNTLNVVKGVKKEIQKLLAEKLPKDIDIQITYDQSQFIQEAISNVRNAAIMGALLAFLVLLIFLRELRSSIAITLSIPISIMATFCLMYFGKINLNMMSLGGLALGVGMLVDNSIVVIENIFRHRQLKKALKQACIEGTGEMVGPIFGSTLTTIAVFLPFAFVVGVIGQIFKQLSLTITFALVVSIIVALSLVPVLISLLSQKTKQTNIISKFLKNLSQNQLIQSVHGYLDFSFDDFIEKMIENKVKVTLVVVACFALGIIILMNTPRQFLPKVDQRQFVIKIDLPPGSRLELTDTVVKKFERLLLKLPETKDVTVNIGSSEEKSSAEETSLQTLGSHQAQIMVNLKKRSKQLNVAGSTEEVIQYLKDNLKPRDLENAEVEYIIQETSLGSALEQGAPLAIEVKGFDLDYLTRISTRIQSEISKVEEVYGVKTSMPAASPETKLHILKDKASLYGLSVRDIALTAQVALKGYVATKFKERQGQEDVDIRVRLRPQDRKDLSNLRRLLIHSPLGMDVSLSDVAYLTKGRGPTEIKRVDQQRSVVLTANAYTRDFNQAAMKVEKIINALEKEIPKDYSIELVGEQQRMKESFRSLAFAMILAFILVYMIMAGEFESLWQPFLIMLTIPLSLIGVAFVLFISRTPLSAIAYLGIIMLSGIAVNNGIVLIDFINVLRRQGLSPYEAALQASKTRFRPIMMTSLTTILGLSPLALGIGEGAELQSPLAITVMGGLTSAAFLTLVFIPALYLIVVQYVKRVPLLHPKAELAMPAPVTIAAHGKKEMPPEPEVSETVIETKPAVELIPEAKETISEKKEPPPAKEEEAEVKKEPAVKPGEEKITEEKIPAAPIPKIKKKKLNARQKQLLEKLKEMKKITRKEYARMLKISVPTASRDLKSLVNKGLIKGKGPLGPGRWYELV